MERKGWFDWRAVWSVLIAVIVLLFAITLLAFLAQRSISPSSGSGVETQTVRTTSTLP
jgi:hypothetical protein